MGLHVYFSSHGSYQGSSTQPLSENECLFGNKRMFVWKCYVQTESKATFEPPQRRCTQSLITHVNCYIDI